MGTGGVAGKSLLRACSPGWSDSAEMVDCRNVEHCVRILSGTGTCRSLQVEHSYSNEGTARKKLQHDAISTYTTSNAARRSHRTRENVVYNTLPTMIVALAGIVCALYLHYYTNAPLGDFGRYRCHSKFSRSARQSTISAESDHPGEHALKSDLPAI